MVIETAQPAWVWPISIGISAIPVTLRWRWPVRSESSVLNELVLSVFRSPLGEAGTLNGPTFVHVNATAVAIQVLTRVKRRSSTLTGTDPVPALDVQKSTLAGFHALCESVSLLETKSLSLDKGTSLLAITLEPGSSVLLPSWDGCI
ncbi:hypothetical protein AAFF_G00207400 [Aldrovandia affinis]|uniref:Uncharacterized protein n=1 Tax=Aldrovandia affinis TaxID=143900 RepID=A0AAD7R004_9TELE|nr:hypothetical protein AAFF_G00207400 [Aldrovandia affinis]